MIVKNESKRLPTLFETLKDVIDYYVIVDTGSTDNTPEFIKETMNSYGIEGEVHHHDWVNFGVCRNVALKHAVGKAEYVLIIDADEELHYSDLDFFKNLNKDYYCLKRKYSSIEYYLPAILNIGNNNELEWEWKGPVHNYLNSKSKTKEYVDIEKVWIRSHVHGGAKSHNVTSKQKYMRDVKLLKEELKRVPNDTRSTFYLAQSYNHAGDFKNAIKWYQKRVELVGWSEEVYMSLYNIGVCKQRMGCDFESEVLYDYLRAYNFRKTRLEALYEIVYYYRTHNMKKEGYCYGLLGYENEFPKDSLFVNTNIHSHMFLDELAVCAYWVGDHDLAIKLNNQMLNKDLDKNYRSRIQKNLEFSLDKK
jgi:glycosyltransferase involved in cell wall biosynthesis